MPNGDNGDNVGDDFDYLGDRLNDCVEWDDPPQLLEKSKLPHSSVANTQLCWIDNRLIENQV
jgi:hypothetical protein